MRAITKLLVLGFAIAAAWWLLVRRDHHDAPARSTDRIGTTAPSLARTPKPNEPALATITGHVVDTANAPLDGVHVCAEMPTPRCALSDGNGAYAITDLVVDDARGYDVAAVRPHYIVASEQHVTTSTANHADVVVTMKPGGVELVGFVRNADGAPIVNAFVSGDNAIAKTDLTGAYTLWLDPDASTIVTASADGYASSRGSSRPPDHLDFALVPEATLEGEVVDATTGRAMPDVSVVVRCDSSIADVVVTDSDGRFRITKLPPSIYTLDVSDRHLTAVRTSSVPLAIGEHVEAFEVRVVPAFEVDGRIVVDRSGDPCTHSSVTLTAGQDSHWVAEDDDGIVRAGALRPGTYHVDITCEHHRGRDHYDDITVTDHDVVDQIWKVTDGAAVIGRVVDSSGAPIADAIVYADEIQPSDPANRSNDNAHTATDGRFALGGLRPGRHQLSISVPHGGIDEADNVVVEVAADRATRHDFVVERSAGDLEGRVVFADGSPARNVDVELRDVSRDSIMSVTTDDAGHFTASSMRGELRVSLSVRGVALPLAGDDLVHVVPAATSHLELATTATIGEIRGRVIDEAGQPVDDAYVSIEPYDADDLDSGHGVTNEVMVDADGHFRAGQLPETTYRVRAYRKSGGTTIVQPVERGSDITVVLAAAGSITGVVHLDGAPVQRFAAHLDDGASNNEVQTLDAFALDGQFELHGVAPGHYRVRVSSDCCGASIDVDVAAGQDVGVDVALDHAATVSGRIVDEATGLPLPSIRISPNQAYTPDRFTDAAGRFAVTVPLRGPLIIWVMAPTDQTSTSWSGIATKELVVDADSIDVGDIAVTLPDTLSP